MDNESQRDGGHPAELDSLTRRLTLLPVTEPLSPLAALNKGPQDPEARLLAHEDPYQSVRDTTDRLLPDRRIGSEQTEAGDNPDPPKSTFGDPASRSVGLLS